MRSIWVALLVLSFGVPARAAECPAIDGGGTALLQHDTQARLDFVHRELRRDGVQAGRWWTGWLVTSSILAVAQAGGGAAGTLVKAPDTERIVGKYLKANQVQLYEGAATTVVGIASLLITPLRSMWDGPALDLKLAKPLSDNPCVVLREAEQMLLRDGTGEANGHSILIHLGNAALNIGGGLVMGIFFHQWINGLEAAVIGTAVGELMIFTQPTGSEKALARYRAGDLSQPATPAVRLEAGPVYVALRF